MACDIWVISDTHFGHANIIKYCNRPFKDEHEMDEVMVERWNEVVRPNHKVYHCGDVYFREGYRHLPRLMGQKRLILGNHDHGQDKNLLAHFKKIQGWRMFPEFGLLLTHVPVHPETLNVNKCPRNVHGHIHERRVRLGSATSMPDTRYRNVAVERIDYRPIHIDELRVW